MWKPDAFKRSNTQPLLAANREAGNRGSCIVKRRDFLRTLLAGGAGAMGAGAWLFGQETASPKEQGPSNRHVFTLARIMYRGAWNAAYPNSDRNLISHFAAKTKDRFATDYKPLTLSDERIFNYPILYLTGFGVQGSFSAREAEMLRKHLVNGGFLFASDCGTGGTAFRDSVTHLVEQQTFRRDRKLVSVPLDREDHPLLNLVVPFDRWSPGIYLPGRFTAWEYDGRLVAYMASQFDHNCILARRADDSQIIQQALDQSCNALYYALTH